MAPRVPNRVRTVAVATFVVAAAVTALVAPSIASATPSPSPSASAKGGNGGSAADVEDHISSVQQRLDRLSRRNDLLVEKYNQAGIAYRKTRLAAAAARANVDATERKLAVAKQQFSATAASQYESGSYSATGALLSSSSDSNYLDQLQTMTMLSAHNAQIVSNYTTMQKAEALAKQQANAAYAAAANQRTSLAKQKALTAKQIAKYRTLLDSLNAQQRAIWAQQASRVDNQKAVNAMRPAIKTAFRNGFSSPKLDSAIIRRAVTFALSQVGKPYVWGASGPGSYDCSGLTMASYAHAGISLPHSAAQQYGFGHHVSFNQMQPGDLMFWYSPIGHVAMYIGGGMMVTAPQTGENVQIASARDNASDFVGATRLVG